MPPLIPTLTPTTTPTTTPATSTTTPPPATTPPSAANPTAPGQTGRAVLPTSANTLKVASVGPEVVTERRWALTAIVLIFGGGAIATARIRRRPRD